jgi:hypothetical protein
MSTELTESQADVIRDRLDRLRSLKPHVVCVSCGHRVPGSKEEDFRRMEVLEAEVIMAFVLLGLKNESEALAAIKVAYGQEEKKS